MFAKSARTPTRSAPRTAHIARHPHTQHLSLLTHATTDTTTSNGICSPVWGCTRRRHGEHTQRAPCNSIRTTRHQPTTLCVCTRMLVGCINAMNNNRHRTTFQAHHTPLKQPTTAAWHQTRQTTSCCLGVRPTAPLRRARRWALAASTWSLSCEVRHTVDHVTLLLWALYTPLRSDSNATTTTTGETASAPPAVAARASSTTCCCGTSLPAAATARHCHDNG